MQQHDFIKSFWIMTVLGLTTSVVVSAKPTLVRLTPEGEKLEAHYSKMLEDLRKEIVFLAPKVDEKVKTNFTEQLTAQ